MEFERTSEIMRECHVQRKSVEQAVEAGVDEFSIVEFFEARAAGSFVVEDGYRPYKYTPSIKSSIAAYHACEGDIEKMHTISETAKEHAKEAVGELQKNWGDIDSKDVLGTGKTFFDQEVANQCDDWFERMASN